MKILVATGGATHSDLAVETAAALAVATGGTLAVLYVNRAGRSGRADEIFDHVESILPEPRPVIQRRERWGHPGEEIVREAREGGYDCIVIGERPLHRLIRRFISPIGRRIMERMPCPVLVARTPLVLPGRVLVCEGGRRPAVVTRLARQLPAVFDLAQKITLLHVMSHITAAPGIRGWELRAEAEELIARDTQEGQMLRDLVETYGGGRDHISPKIRHGLVVDEVAAETREQGYDLLVIGVNQNEGWEWLLFDDLAQQIMRQTELSVLVV